MRSWPRLDLRLRRALVISWRTYVRALRLWLIGFFGPHLSCSPCRRCHRICFVLLLAMQQQYFYDTITHQDAKPPHAAFSLAQPGYRRKESAHTWFLLLEPLASSCTLLVEPATVPANATAATILR